jgi:phosphomannomutase
VRLLKLGTAGIRGEIGGGLNPFLAIDFAAAAGTYFDGGRVAIARDTRVSSEMLTRAVKSALMACGSEIIDAGVAPAPLLHWLTPRLECDGALLIGAGHHPAGWNAIVPLDAGGAYFNSIRTQELLDIYNSKKYKCVRWDRTGKVKSAPADSAAGYADMLCSKINTDAIKAKKYRVVTDFCNGSGSVTAALIAERLGIEMIPINSSLSGILPHDPEPRPRSSTQVQSVMLPLGAAIGFVHNSDMSRTAVVTNSGETLSEEYTFPLVADHALASRPGRKLAVTNWCSTKTFDDIASNHGAEIRKTKVGQAFIIDQMLESGASLAGDGSGSVALAEFTAGFDGCLAAALILESMALSGASSSDLAARLPRYHIVKRKVHCASANAYSLIRSLRWHFPDAAVSEEDGLRFDWPDGWIHLRASATEPVIRTIVEWRTKEEAEDRAVHVLSLIERLVA